MNEIGISLDTVWMLLAAMLVFWMQPGFARLYVWRRRAWWFHRYA